MYDKEQMKKHLNKIKDIIYDKINLNEITVLTGNNGSGKSLIRKYMHLAIADKYTDGDSQKTKGLIRSISMDTRTKTFSEFGALSSFGHDLEWLATSQNTYYLLTELFNSIERDNNNLKYVILDEFEIGASEETVLAFINYINEHIKKIKENNKKIGFLIITHSRLVVEKLNYNNFINIEGLTKEEWLNRKIIPTDLKKLDDNELFYYLRDKNG